MTVGPEGARIGGLRERDRAEEMGGDSHAQPVRVLHVLGRLNLGGAESRIMDLYRQIDRSRVQFDFVIHVPEAEGPSPAGRERETDGLRKPDYFEGEILSLGGRVYRLPQYRGYNDFSYRNAWKRFFRECPEFCCVHGHMTSTASIYLPIAKRCGVPVTVAHARNAGVERGAKGILTKLLRMPLARIADFCFATSRLAGEAVFGRRAMAAGKVHVLPNAIQVAKYGFRPQTRDEVRKRLGLGDAVAVGHVGRFHPQKNHSFLVDVFARIQELAPQSVLLLLGAGEGMGQIQEKVRALGLEDKVRFLGNHSDVADYYQAMDVMIFPSLYEGLPGAVLEAQTSGLPCGVSSAIDGEAGIADCVTFLSLSESADRWARTALAVSAAPRRDRQEEMRRAGFDVTSQVEWMLRFYETGRLPEGL